MAIPHLDPDTVSDRESFINFVQALVDDRKQAETLERDQPESYRWDGANGWQNSTISTFLEGALSGSDARKVAAEPSWRDFALFLFLGKIYE
jgi:hypothetical protein